MLKPTTQNWFFPTLSGVFYATLSVIFFIYAADGLRSRSTLATFGDLALAAGVCVIAAGIWKPASDRSWFLALEGLTCSALGLLITFWRGSIAFRTIAALIVVMAVSLGIHELQTTLSAHLSGPRKWFSAAASIISFGFALAFLGFFLRLIPLAPSPSVQTFLWIGSYFGFSALCMLGMTLHSRAPGLLMFRDPITYPH